MAGCGICARPDRAALEDSAREALAGQISWRAAGRKHDVNPEALKRHMVKDVVSPEVAAIEEAEANELDELMASARAELMTMFHLAPADVKPLILVAIRNLEGLKQMKPSQEVLIRSLKTIQEMTGMKTEQRLMLDYAKALQNSRPARPLQVVNEAQALEAG